MSYRVSLPPNRRAGLRFLSHVRHELLKAFAEEAEKQGRSQAQIARDLGVNRSVINRTLSGGRDIMASRIGELAWALDRCVEFSLKSVATEDRIEDIAAERLTGSTWYIPSNDAQWVTLSAGDAWVVTPISITAGTGQSSPKYTTFNLGKNSTTAHDDA